MSWYIYIFFIIYYTFSIKTWRGGYMHNASNYNLICVLDLGTQKQEYLPYIK